MIDDVIRFHQVFHCISSNFPNVVSRVLSAVFFGWGYWVQWPLYWSGGGWEYRSDFGGAIMGWFGVRLGRRSLEAAVDGCSVRWGCFRLMMKIFD